MARTEADLRAVARSTIEQFADKYPNLKGRITIRFRKCRNACAYWLRRLITLPKHLLTRSEPYAIHVIVHELAHIAAPAHEKHGPIFRRIEIDMHKPWGLVPADYARAYCRKLYQDGELVWEHPKRIKPKRVLECGLKLGDCVKFRGKDWSPWYGKVIKMYRVNVAVDVVYPAHRRNAWRIRAQSLTKISKEELAKKTGG